MSYVKIIYNFNFDRQTIDIKDAILNHKIKVTKNVFSFSELVKDCIPKERVTKNIICDLSFKRYWCKATRKLITFSELFTLGNNGFERYMKASSNYKSDLWLEENPPFCINSFSALKKEDFLKKNIKIISEFEKKFNALCIDDEYLDID